MNNTQKGKFIATKSTIFIISLSNISFTSKYILPNYMVVQVQIFINLRIANTNYKKKSRLPISLIDIMLYPPKVDDTPYSIMCKKNKICSNIT